MVIGEGCGLGDVPTASIGLLLSEWGGVWSLRRGVAIGEGCGHWGGVWSLGRGVAWVMFPQLS